jgi:hypothetical protein
MSRVKAPKRKHTHYYLPNRLRNIPVQIWLSEDERERLRQKTERYGCTNSELVRRWILAEPRIRARKAKTPTPEDPRQLTVTQHINSGERQREDEDEAPETRH